MSLSPDSQQQRIVESLTGWRLVAAVISSVANIGLFAWLTFTHIVLSDQQLTILMSVIAAQIGIVALAVGATRIRISSKICIVATNTIWAMAIIDRLWGAELTKGLEAFAYPIHAAILLYGATKAQIPPPETEQNPQRSFQTSDLLTATATIAILISVWQYLSPNWWEAVDPSKLVLIPWIIVGMFNAIWICIVLQLFLTPTCLLGLEFRNGTRIAIAGLILIWLPVVELISTLITIGPPFAPILYLISRSIFLFWTMLSLVPVFNQSLDKQPKLIHDSSIEKCPSENEMRA